MNNTSFSEQEIIIFKEMIGKQFNMFKCDSFIYSPSVYGIVGIYVDGEAYKLTSLYKTITRFFNIDDVALFHIEPSSDSEIKSFMDDGELINNPVLSRIVSIDVVTYHQSIEHNGKKQSFDYSTGIIFHLEDEREISFEIKTWFSEMITIEKGYNLISKFKSIDDFIEEWDNCDGYIAKCTREIVTIK